MARRGRPTPTHDDQMSLDFLWGADTSTDNTDSSADSDNGVGDEQQVTGTPVAGTQAGETDERDLHRIDVSLTPDV